jgi:hypothetical protein
MSSDALLPPPPPPGLADAREHAIRVLTDRYADDTLSTGEFEARLDRLYATQTPAAVAALTADLAVTRAVPAAAPAPARYAPPAPYVAPTEQRLLCVFAERHLGGRWAPGAHFEGMAAFAELTLDLREAALGAGCEIEVQAYLASVRVLLPSDAVLDLQVGPVLGSVVDDTTPSTGHDGPRVRLRGVSFMAEVAVRRAPAELPPDAPFKLAWREAGRAAKRARRGR